MNYKRTASIIIGLVFASFAFVAPAYASEKPQPTLYSSDDTVLQLQKQVAQLLEQISAMQKQLDTLLKQRANPSVVPTKKYEDADEYKDKDEKKYSDKKTEVHYVYIVRPLYIGVEGEDVTTLQEFLAADPNIYPEGLVTGYYGTLTERAVKKWQDKHGIETVGVVGPKTREVLNKKLGYWETDAKKEEYKKEEYKKEEYKKDSDSEYHTTVTKIELHADDANDKVWWKEDGYSDDGFKVVWSKTSGPTYPTRDSDKYIYLSSPEADHSRLEAFDGEGTYYVRVCEYEGGKCDVYSNEVALKLTI